MHARYLHNIVKLCCGPDTDIQNGTKEGLDWMYCSQGHAIPVSRHFAQMVERGLTVSCS